MSELLDINALKQNRTAIANINYCGIYFLFDSDELVYVGQSVNVFARIGQHIGYKEFTHWTFINCNQHELDYLEVQYIWKFKPRLNSNTHKFLLGFEKLRKRIGVPSHILVGIVAKHAVEHLEGRYNYFEVRQLCIDNGLTVKELWSK
jgi:hypothetical protein